MDLMNFDANQVAPAGDFSPVPAGKYEVVITESEQIANKSGVGSHLLLTLTIASGPHEGRTVWHRLNLDNPSEKAVQISRGQLSSICRAVNVLTPKDSHDLHLLPFMASVVQEAYDGGVSNKCTSFSSRDGAAQAPAAAAAPAPAPAAPGAGSAPWKKK